MSQDESQSPPPRLPGGHLAAGIFLTVGAASLLGGVIGLLDAENVGFPANAVGCGIAFIALFVAAVLLRPGSGGDALRGALGVTSVLFLVACFGFAVDLGGSGSFYGQSLRVKLAAAAALFALGMGGIGVAVPSAVASGLAVLGVEGAVTLSLFASGVSSPEQIGVAVVLTAVAAMLVALRVPALRPHRTGLAWMVSVAAVLAAPAVTALASDFNGAAVAASGALAFALAALAWRHRLVVAAVVAVPALVVIEVYVADQVAGRDSASGQAATVLVIGAAMLVLVAVVGIVARTRTARLPTRGVRVEEVLLLAVAALALISLTVPGQAGLPLVPHQPGLGLQPASTSP